VKELLVKFLVWRIRHVKDKNFLLILGGIIGIIAGLAAVLLKLSVHAIQKFLTQDFDVGYENYLYLSYPLVGILLTLVVAKFILKEKLGHGITQILYSISKKSSIIRGAMMYSRMITSALTVGFGGSVGLEAPIVVTGSAIGSNLGRLAHLDYKKRTLLIGCGAAGAISAIFNSPIAGVIFSIEVILMDVTIAAFIPLLISSVAASMVSIVLNQDQILFSFRIQDPFMAIDLPYFILLGIVCGVVSVHFTRMTYAVEGIIKKVKNDYSRAITGGILLGVIIFLFPPIFGEGYNTIKSLLSNDAEVLNTTLFFGQSSNPLVLILFIFGVVVIKPVASALTIGSGGSGGIFAPSLFMGGTAGFVFAETVNLVMGSEALSTSNFVLVGMCGVMSGVMHSPLTAIFLIAEITSGYELFVPLMLVSAASFSVVSYFEKHSLYTKHLIEQGDLIKYDRDLQVLSLINLKKIVEEDLLQIHPDSKLKELVNLVKVSKRNIFPVVKDQQLMGIITLDDIREIMFDKDAQENQAVSSLMHDPPAEVSSMESMQSVMSKFEITGAWNLPVIDDGKYVGFVSKSRIFNTYRQKLIRQDKQ
jgi:CIC family chloride channel protein